MAHTEKTGSDKNLFWAIYGADAEKPIEKKSCLQKFNIKAKKLASSSWFWMTLLVIAAIGLVGIGVMGYFACHHMLPFPLDKLNALGTLGTAGSIGFIAAGGVCALTALIVYAVKKYSERLIIIKHLSYFDFAEKIVDKMPKKHFAIWQNESGALSIYFKNDLGIINGYAIKKEKLGSVVNKLKAQGYRNFRKTH